MKFKVKRLGNHWYPAIKHPLGCIDGFEKKIDLYFSKLDISNMDELTIELEELGIMFEGINIIYFDEADIVRYLMTDDNFMIHFVINGHQFQISTELYWLLEEQFNCNFHKNTYKIHIY